MTQKTWLTQLTHFGSYDLTVITATKHAGLSALGKAFAIAQEEREDSVSSEYSFEELLAEGSVRQYAMSPGEVEWH